MQEKVLGYILLFLGILVIIYSGVNVLMVFTKKTQPVQFIDQQGNFGFNLSVPSETVGQGMEIPVKLNELQPVFELINGVVHLMLMGFISTLGYKIALIGTQLVRPIVIKAKTETVKE